MSNGTAANERAEIQRSAMDRINVGEYPHDMDCGRKEEQGKILIIDRASIFDYLIFGSPKKVISKNTS